MSHQSVHDRQNESPILITPTTVKVLSSMAVPVANISNWVGTRELYSEKQLKDI